MSLRHFYTAIAFGCVVLGGCSSSLVVRKPTIELDKYVVRPGDTVESVAYRYRLSPNELRSINRLSGGSLLRPGLRLTIAEPAVVMAKQGSAQNNRSVVVPAPITRREPVSRIEKVNTVVVPASVRPVVKEEIIESVEFEKPRKEVAAKMPKPASIVVSKSGWVWPAGGAVARGFQPHVVNRQGLDIAARSGEYVVAAADGTVVYSGKDLASQGKLVILRHKGNVLSAYSLADELFVQEDETVKAGDTIAGLGRGENKSSILHFEIRKEGKPVNPLSYLPKR